MTKSEFLQAFVIRCAPIPGCHPIANLAFALEHWEALETHGDKPAAQLRAMLQPASGFTGPNDPRVS